VEAMKHLVDVISRGWFFSPEYTLLGALIDHSIAAISFHDGLVAVQKKTDEHGVYPFQHFHTPGKAHVFLSTSTCFVDLNALQIRTMSLHTKYA
jgi:hypothetical protein